MHGKINSVLASLVVLIGLAVGVSACKDDATVASYNMSKAAVWFRMKW